jgi:hypothetical protein
VRHVAEETEHLQSTIRTAAPALSGTHRSAAATCPLRAKALPSHPLGNVLR